MGTLAPSKEARPANVQFPLALAGGSADFGVAGVLSVKANQAEGAYAGQYVVSVDYQ